MISTVVVEDFELLRELIVKLCQNVPNCGEVISATDGLEAVSLITAHRPGFVIMDLRLPRANGLTVLRHVRELGINPAVLIVTAYQDDFTLWSVENARVQGFICKSECNGQTLQQAIKAISERRCYFSPMFEDRKSFRRSDPTSFDKLISLREREVLSMVGDLADDNQIASALGISVRTVEAHRLNILHKLQLKDRVELIRYARDIGFGEGHSGAHVVTNSRLSAKVGGVNRD